MPLQITRRRRSRAMLALAVSAWLGAMAGPALAQLPPPVDRDPPRVSRTITQFVTEQNLARAAEAAGDLMGEPGARERVLGILKSVEGFGKGQYSDRVYSRAYGFTSYDIIDKINFDGAILFVRYLFHVERGRWILLNLTYKTETKLPFPAEWGHIHP